jgi:CheY-like chemotaxis protein
VLIVDDNATNRRILSQMVGRWSMRPQVAASGDATLALIREAAAAGDPFAVIIVDALMPRMDGFELAEAVAAETRIKPILMLSAADRQAFADRCLRGPFAAYLEKPVSWPDLLDVLRQALHIAAPPTDAPSTTPRCEASVSRPRHVLMADDTRANQKLVTAILGKRGHSVEVVHNGREALDMLKHRDFDAVLMDVQMPIMDGFQATAAIRALPKPSRSQVPIIAMTAHNMPGDRERCLAAGMDAYLGKPIDRQELIQMIEHVETLRAGSQPAASANDRGQPVVIP